MKKGYQLIEPEIMDELLKQPQHHDIAVLILSWLANQINESFPDAGCEVLFAEYFGPYPVLGVGNSQSPSITGIDLEKHANQMMNKASLPDLIKHASTADQSWSEIAKQIAVSQKSDDVE